MSKAHNAIDRTEQVFNSWTIIKYCHTNKDRRRVYLCRCVCGNEIIKPIRSIISGESKSCGCQNIVNHISHGKSSSMVYNIWQSMKNRCLNPNADKYEYYGGRGIKVCERWMIFENFLEDVGEPPTKNHSIDRFPNNDGDYEPSNFRRATKSEQALNRRKKQPLPTPPQSKQTL